MEKLIFHIDVNSAYLSWSAVDRLSKGDSLDLRTIPSVIGGGFEKSKGNIKGIVLAKSIMCNPYKIKTADTLYSALQKCPSLTIVPPQHNLYAKSSQAMFDLLYEYTFEIEPYSIDEVFMDATNIKHEDPIKLADEIRNRIYNELGFTVCVGISSNKILAKMATDLRKPNYTTTLFPEEIEKMWSLPVSKLFMVGNKTNLTLNKFGIETIGDLAKKDITFLESILKSHGSLIWKYANGIDDSKVNYEKTLEKGIGNSTTLPFDIDTLTDANMVLLSLCETVSRRLRKKDFLTETIAVSVRYKDMTKKSAQQKLWTPINGCNPLYNLSKALLENLWTEKPIRQIGVRTANLITSGRQQITLFDNTEYKRERILDKTIDNIREKFGNESIKRACFVNSKYHHMVGGMGDTPSPFSK